ncbi:MAG: hemerythrin domain-containing protein [Dehalococcoidia bacterium]
MPQANGTDPIALLKEDHEKVKSLFDEFEQTSNKRSQQRIIREAILELDVHAGIEEEIFYPAYAEAAKESEDEEIILEAEEEHHVVHLLIGELRDTSEMNDRVAAKFTVLAENVRHHIEEEESEMLPKAQELLGDRLQELGEQMTQRKRELMKELKQA